MTTSSIIGGSANVLKRIWRVLPKGWFQWGAPNRDAILGGLSDSASWCYGLVQYARQQTRLSSANGIWLDIFAYDFLGRTLVRNGLIDDSFRALIRSTVLQERVTRLGMIEAVTLLTGKAPWVFEPWNTGDTGAYSGAPGLAGTTNLLLYSQDLENSAGWSLNGVTITADTTTAPDGSQTADKIAESSGTSQHFVDQEINVVANTTYILSCYFKAAERSYVFFGSSRTELGGPIYVVVNLSNGTVSTATGTPLNVQCISVGNGWYRVSFAAQAAFSGPGNFLAFTSADGVYADLNYAGTPGSGIYAWGAQFEPAVGSNLTPAPYLMTTNASATRSTIAPDHPCGQFGYGVGVGGYGNMNLPGQIFMKIYRGSPSGVPNVAGYGTGAGGYGAGAIEYVNSATAQVGITDAMILQVINLTKPIGSTVWVQFPDS